ncbi:hypothetical protein H4R34_005499 [Dimargaris verticillata]|uniref:Nicotinate phosphoribosyltransferase n=1 Tax=Dimargaris verticillata TaxID=2761393 RepID=A0A9W8AY31_9FUNG|nr:hypothetical protein H4R34_005499 [Dimargaris verticillata]
MDNLTLFTDKYQINMAYAHFSAGRHHHRHVFDVYFRKLPFPDSPYCVFAGLAKVVEYLRGLRFTDTMIAFLAGEPEQYNEAFLTFLRSWRFDATVLSQREGALVFPGEPLMRVEGPILTALMVETALLCIVGYQTLVATKAARVVAAATLNHPDIIHPARQAFNITAWNDSSNTASGDTLPPPRVNRYQPILMEFGSRRAQETEAALWAARSAYLVGFDATSNVLASQRFGIPSVGTQSHAWIESFPDEVTAFRAYAKAFPDNTILLVDTYDTLGSGVPNAIRVAQELADNGGHQLMGIRLDSGDLASLSRQARAMLDEAGFPDVDIIASSDLDEHAILALRRQGCSIDTYGVGTRLTTVFDQPALGMVYKLAATQVRESPLDWTPAIKLAATPEKTTVPGRKLVYRLIAQATNVFYGDYVCLEDEPPAINQPQVRLYSPQGYAGRIAAADYQWTGTLETVVNAGQFRAPACVDFATARYHYANSTEAFPESFFQFGTTVHKRCVFWSEALYNLTQSLIQKRSAKSVS